MAEDLPKFVDPPAVLAWRTSQWAAAVDSLQNGRMELFSDLLERGVPIPIEIGRILALAARGGVGLPFRLEVIANAKPGQKRPGRLPERHTLRNISLACRMTQKMSEGNRYDDAARLVADECCIGERTVKQAYSVFKDIVPEMIAGTAEMARALDLVDTGSPEGTPSGPAAECEQRGNP